MSVAVIDKARKWGRAQVGTTESPPDSNHVKYWGEYHQITGAPAYQGQPWCGCYGICVHHHAGVFTAPANWIGVYAIQSWGEEEGRWHYGSAGIEPMDQLVIGGPGVHTETAFSSTNAAGGIDKSNGGNTSPKVGSGDQYNGGVVALKPRAKSEIYGYVKLHDIYTGAGKTKRKNKAASKPAEPQYTKEAKRGALNLWDTGKRVATMQKALGLDDAGYYGRATAKAVLAYKRKHDIGDKNPTGDTAGAALLNELLSAPAKKQAKPRTLRIHDKGGLVRKLQRLLHKAGYLTAKQVDGDYGPITATAVHKLKVDRKTLSKNGNVAGPNVWKALGQT